MKRVVRFVEDDNPYSAGDFGDNGQQTIDSIASGDTIIVGLVCYDEDAITDLTTDLDLVLNRNPAALLDSLWCIDVDSAAINDTGKDFYADTVGSIGNDYLRTLATEHLSLGGGA